MQWYWIVIISVLGLWVVYSFVTSITMFHYSTRPKKFTDEECIKREKELIKYDSTNYDNFPREPFELDSDNAKIKGYIIHNARKTDKVAIIVHGFTASVISCAKYGEIFYDLGYNVVTFDQRYFGQSTGECCTMGYSESKDLLKVIDFVKTKFTEPKIVLHGESMGAATVLLTLPKTDDSILYAVADCSFSRCVKLYRYLTKKSTLFLSSFPITDLACLWNRLRYGFWSQKVNPIEAVQNTNKPILFIHGKADDFIPCYMSEQMYEKALSSISQLYLAPDAKHAMSFTADQIKYKELIKNFDKKINTNGGTL
ncbi:MAG TPA: alpha/beta fold hydrolase [Clostridia bacterium]|nr:alpha/beta fold hydrolase [Clostridia bacterium]